MFDYLMKIPEFLIEYKNFKDVTISKLNEIKNDTVLNDINDNRINNREFIFNKFNEFDKYLSNLKDYNKNQQNNIIITI